MLSTSSSFCVIAPRRCSGAILVSSLLLLVIMTVLALGASRVTRMQTAEPNRLQQGIVAFQAAEAALAAGERVVSEPDFAPPALPCSSGRCRVYAAGSIDLSAARRSPAWWDEHGWRHVPERSSIQSQSEGELWFVLEELTQRREDMGEAAVHPVPRPDHYRITAANLREGRIRVVLQSVVVPAPEVNIDDPHAVGNDMRAAGRQSWRQLL